MVAKMAKLARSFVQGTPGEEGRGTTHQERDPCSSQLFTIGFITVDLKQRRTKCRWRSRYSISRLVGVQAGLFSYASFRGSKSGSGMFPGSPVDPKVSGLGE